MVKKVNTDSVVKEDNVLASAIGDLGAEQPRADDSRPEEKLGEKARIFGTLERKRTDDFKDIDERADNLSFRLGWNELPVSELGERSVFYPASWEFRIKPAGVEAIKNWSTIDENNPMSIETVFNEILKNCFSIKDTRTGEVIRYDKLNAWDRFWVILKIREYSMPRGETKVEYNEECDICGKEIAITFNSSTVAFEMPDEDVIDKYWKRDEGYWYIDPEEFEVKGKPFVFYNPTIETSIAINDWIYRKMQNEKTPDNAFLKFLPYMLKKVSRDPKVMDMEVRKAKAAFDLWDEEQYLLADDILRNIMVTPTRYLKVQCPYCGEEVHSAIRFPNGIKSILAVQNRRKKFGSK